MYTDLDAFIADLSARGLLARVAEQASPALEISAVVDRACKSPGGGPALLFEKPTGFDMPVAANLFGSLSRISIEHVANLKIFCRTPIVPRSFLALVKGP